jgi:DNA-binding LacI/PurR family transcriptional regulator
MRYLMMYFYLSTYLSDCTAIIFPNDNQAKKFCAWALTNHVYLPPGLSRISFDNATLIYPFQIDSVDFGFEYLGSMAFHVLSGDVRIDVGRDNAVSAKPSIINHGSVAPMRPIAYPWRT